MLFSKLLAVALPVMALAAPAPNPNLASDKTIDELFHVEGDVLVGPGGYMKEGVFHPGEYKSENAKRDETHQHEARTLLGLLLLKKFKGKWQGGGGGGGGDVCGPCLQGQNVGAHPNYIYGSGAGGSWVWGSGGFQPGYPCGSNVCQ